MPKSTPDTRRPVPFVALLAILAVACLPLGCQKVVPTPKNVPSGTPNVVPGSITFEGGGQVRVQVLTTAEQREMAPTRTAFDVVSGIAHGLLHAYPADTSVVFRQHMCAMDTEVAFINGDNKVVDVSPVPATPRKIIGGEVPAQFRNQPNFDPEMWLAMENQMTGAFAIDPLQDVRWAVQVPIGWCAANKIAPGTGVQIPADVADQAKSPESVFPQIEFNYTPWTGFSSDRNSMRVKRFSLRTAFTPEARRLYLAAAGIKTLGPTDAVLVAWPDERIISLQTRDLTEPIFIVPVRANANTGMIDSVRGDLIELRPAEYSRNAGREPVPTAETGWEGDGFARNWEYRSKDKHHGFLMIGGAALYPLKMEPSHTIFGGFKDDFSCEVPESVKRTPVLPDPTSVEISLTPEGEAAVAARVRVLATDQERYRGLANIGPLPEAGAAGGNNGDNGGGTAPAPVFNPEVDQPDPGPEAWLLMFDRNRQRPLFSGGLTGSYDLIVFDRDNRLSRVVKVDKPGDLAWPEFSTESYRYLIVAPRGWLAHKSLATIEGNPLPKIKLDLPSEVTRMQPEPERYEVTIGGHTAWVEVVFDRFERNRGLMWRRTIEPDCGMVFLYTEARTRAFWMQNCYVDLDIAYIRDDWTIARELTMQHPLLPGDTQPEDGPQRPVTRKELSDAASSKHGSGEEVRFALEMSAGWFKAHGVSKDAKIEAGPVVAQFLTRTTE